MVSEYIIFLTTDYYISEIISTTYSRILQKQVKIKMSSLSFELRRTIAGQLAYASDRSYLEYLNDSLRDIGITDSNHLPSFRNSTEETAVKELLRMREHLYEMRDLAYNIKAHRAIIDRVNDGTVELSAGEYEFHQTFITENEPRIREFELATETPTQMINRKLNFLEGLRSRITPHPWCPDQSPRPDLAPLIDGAASFLNEQKSRIESERICLHQDISGFSDDYISDFLKKYSSIPSWSRIDFREQWARNIPPYSLPPGVDFINRPIQVTSVLNDNANSESHTTVSEARPTRCMLVSCNSRPTRSVSESEQDLFGEDSDEDVEILPPPPKKQGLASI